MLKIGIDKFCDVFMRSDQSDLSSLFCSLDLEGRIQILFLLESDPDFPWVGILRFDFDVSAVFFSLHGRDIFSLRIFCELRLLFWSIGCTPAVYT